MLPARARVVRGHAGTSTTFPKGGAIDEAVLRELVRAAVNHARLGCTYIFDNLMCAPLPPSSSPPCAFRARNVWETSARPATTPATTTHRLLVDTLLAGLPQVANGEAAYHGARKCAAPI